MTEAKKTESSLQEKTLALSGDMAYLEQSGKKMKGFVEMTKKYLSQDLLSWIQLSLHAIPRPIKVIDSDCTSMSHKHLFQVKGATRARQCNPRLKKKRVDL